VLYSFSYAANGSLGGTAVTQATGANAAAECSPVTYFTNNTTSKIFTGIGYANAGAADSYTVSNTGTFSGGVSDTTPNSLGGTSGIIVDNSSATAGDANVYFTGLAAGNVTSGAGAGNCKSFTVGGSSSGTTVTLTGSGFNFAAGQTIVVSGFTNNSGNAPTRANFNGTWVVAASPAPSGTSVTYTDANVSGTNNSQGGRTASWGTCGFQLSQTLLQ
jgi:hypothetical protein